MRHVRWANPAIGVTGERTVTLVKLDQRYATPREIEGGSVKLSADGGTSARTLTNEHVFLWLIFKK